jgi:hypothetical protein
MPLPSFGILMSFRYRFSSDYKRISRFMLPSLKCHQSKFQLQLDKSSSICSSAWIILYAPFSLSIKIVQTQFKNSIRPKDSGHLLRLN